MVDAGAHPQSLHSTFFFFSNQPSPGCISSLLFLRSASLFSLILPFSLTPFTYHSHFLSR